MAMLRLAVLSPARSSERRRPMPVGTTMILATPTILVMPMHPATLMKTTAMPMFQRAATGTAPMVIPMIAGLISVMAAGITLSADDTALARQYIRGRVRRPLIYLRTRAASGERQVDRVRKRDRARYWP